MNIGHLEEIEGLHAIIDDLREQVAFHRANHELLALGMKSQKMMHDRMLLDYEDAVNHNAELLMAAGDDCESEEVMH